MNECCETFHYIGTFETRHNTLVEIYVDLESQDYFILWREVEGE